METEQKKKPGLIIIIVLLSLLVVGLGCYVIYDKFIVNNDTKEKEDGNKSNEEILDINSSLVKQLYKLLFNDIDNDWKFYSDKIVRINDIDSDFRLIMAGRLLLDNNYLNALGSNTCIGVNGEDDYFDGCKTVNGDVIQAYVDEETGVGLYKSTALNILNELYYKNYGSNAPDLPKDLETWFTYEKMTGFDDGLSLQIIGNNVYFYSSGGYGGSWEEVPLFILDSAKKINNEIYLYEYFAVSNIEETLSEDQIKLQNHLFKHTFKQNSDGSYYWYSSEPVNK